MPDVTGWFDNDPRYTPSTTFDTFPFPNGITPNIPTANLRMCHTPLTSQRRPIGSIIYGKVG
jgi:hypothetical protein